MSYDVDLVGADGQVVEVDNHAEGGTYVVGGTTEASLNITYNYGPCFRLVLPTGDLHKDLDGKRAGDVIPVLEQAVDRLGTRQYNKDYWAPTPGNAGHALNVLLVWAKQYPDATFKVS